MESPAVASSGTYLYSARQTDLAGNISPASGTNNGTVTVTPDITGLAPGTYTGNVTVDGGAISGSPQTIPVTLTVAAPPPPTLSVTHWFRETSR